MAQKIKGQLIQFGFIGMSNAIVDIVSLNVLLLLWPTKDSFILLVFNTIAYILVMLNSYIWNTRYTFKHRATTNSKEIMLFILQAVIALAISNIIFISFFQLLEMNMIGNLSAFIEQNIAKVSAMVLSSTASFVMMKFFVFRPKKEVGK
ncbi:GtrA family protein [Aquibacillus saliphilus]|uniref:GtrA family protein n=1 Tax=Aquibacillus saliphilus TaxID=1909422 RepID=UPI001CF01715|nr:GtrA family protein [Aquibacillus saliphilus]